jgi:5-methylcytosine-specific restriction endonuclease McrA
MKLPIAKDWYSHACYVDCPKCGFNYLHQSAPNKCNNDYIGIDFWCEGCCKTSTLEISQNKGQTLIEWAKPVQRKPIKPSLRFEILKRDGYRCQMCGVTAKDGATLEIDHITPVSKGGGNDADNLQVLCRDCNAGKSDQWQ